MSSAFVPCVLIHVWRRKNPLLIRLGYIYICQTERSCHTHTHTVQFLTEGLFALSIRSRCERSGRRDKNRQERGKTGTKKQTRTGSDRSQVRQTIILEDKCTRLKSTRTQVPEEFNLLCQKSSSLLFFFFWKAIQKPLIHLRSYHDIHTAATAMDNTHKADNVFQTKNKNCNSAP